MQYKNIWKNKQQLHFLVNNKNNNNHHNVHLVELFVSLDVADEDTLKYQTKEKKKL
ncbi:unnamed protein product [Meloidogyne enterolobii]|uniref:Uncharacterized protein n=1 Tax=Meloidogyne enterolobii TaxID=390850 RepID=A0ACB0Z3D5_MELEN